MPVARFNFVYLEAANFLHAAADCPARFAPFYGFIDRRFVLCIAATQRDAVAGFPWVVVHPAVAVAAQKAVQVGGVAEGAE